MEHWHSGLRLLSKIEAAQQQSVPAARPIKTSNPVT
jgi:hypothetical protein